MLKRQPSTRDILTISSLAVLGLLLTAGLVVFNGWLAGRYGKGAEILTVWNGTRAFLVDQTDPYSQTMQQRNQIQVYGRTAQEGEDPYALDVPFPLLLLFFPPLLIYRGLTMLDPNIAMPDPLWIRAVWLTFSELGLVGLVMLALQLTEWNPKPWFRVLLAALALTSFYSVTALLDGSLSILIALAILGALVMLRRQHDEAAGMLLAIASVKWEVALIVFAFIVVGAFLARRWYVFAGYAMVWVVLGGTGFLLYPGWIWPYLRSVTAELRAGVGQTLAKTLALWQPDLADRLAVLTIAILLLILVLEWFAALRRNDFRRVTWAAALSLAISPLTGLPTGFANLAPLFFSFVVILPFAWERWEKRPYLVLTLLSVLFVVTPLVIRWQVADPALADALTYLFPSVFTLVGLYWIRWYVVRPPRTWLDSARREIRK
jgi:hypothetical protein